MASFKNYSPKERNHLDADAFASPELIERTKVNEHMIKSFENVKDKWMEYCSYFRAYP